MAACPHCRAELSEAARFCKNCGASVPEPMAAGLIPADAVPEGPTLKPTPGWRPRLPQGRQALWLARGTLALALLGTGFLGGWAAGSERSLVTAEPTGDPTPERTFDQSSDLSMPDVRGLSLHDAQQTLADAGVAVRTISVVDQPAAGPSGLVLTQDPVYGATLRATTTLHVSRPATVPPFAGRSAEDVLADLDELGAETQTLSRYVPGVSPGRVASITPPPGTALPVAVTVVIGAEPEWRALIDVAPVEDSCYTEDDSLAGATYHQLLTCETDRSPLNQTWVIKKAATSLTGVLGVPDTAEAGDAVQVEIVADGVTRQTLTASYGQTVPFRVDVTGVLRLTLRVRSTTRDYSTAGLARLRLLGDSNGLASLEDSGW